MAKEEIIKIVPLDIKKTKITIVGDSPLIVHAWSEKAKKQLLDTYMGKTKTKSKDKKDPFDEFIHSMYWLTDMPESTEAAYKQAVLDGAKWGFPVTSIKKAANSAAFRMKWMKNKTDLGAAYFLRSEFGELAEIKGNPPIMREDLVRVSTGTPDLRYRGMFENWSMDFEIEFNASGAISLEQIINAINAGGFAIGIGEWRPEKGGTFGTYHVET